MKKIVVVAVFLFAVAVSATFAQTTAEEWFKKAGEYFNKGDYTNAITAYSEAIKLGSSNLDAYWFRGNAYYQIKNYDAAIADCSTVINGAPDFSIAYVVRGDFYGAKGIYHKAVTDYKKSFEKGYDPSKSSTLTVDKSSKADMWFCGAMYMEIVVNRFLGKSDVVTKYENWLKTVCDKNNVTRAEVEAYYRNGIRGLVSDVVDENIAKSRFGAPTAQALAEIKNIITQFFLDPTLDNLIVMHQRYRYYANTDGNRGSAAMDILRDSVYSFNLALGDAMLDGRLPVAAGSR